MKTCLWENIQICLIVNGKQDNFGFRRSLSCIRLSQEFNTQNLKNVQCRLDISLEVESKYFLQVLDKNRAHLQFDEKLCVKLFTASAQEHRKAKISYNLHINWLHNDTISPN